MLLSQKHPMHGAHASAGTGDEETSLRHELSFGGEAFLADIRATARRSVGRRLLRARASVTMAALRCHGSRAYLSVCFCCCFCDCLDVVGDARRKSPSRACREYDVHTPQERLHQRVLIKPPNYCAAHSNPQAFSPAAGTRRCLHQNAVSGDLLPVPAVVC